MDFDPRPLSPQTHLEQGDGSPRSLKYSALAPERNGLNQQLSLPIFSPSPERQETKNPLSVSTAQSKRPMEQFHDGHHVRLRSRLHHTYLHAEEDGHGVSLHPRRASMNAAWAVHLLLHENEQYLLLRSAAYGGYLAATGAPSPFGHGGLRVEQRNYDHPEVMATVWTAIPAAGDHVLLCHITRGCLRANMMNGYIHLNNGVSVEDIDDDDIAGINRMMHWIVEPIPAREGMPALPPPIELHLLPAMFRLIYFVWPGVDVDAPFSFLLFCGRSVLRLRNELAMRLDLDAANLVMCLRTGVDDQLTPLLVDLPANQETLHIVVVIAGTPAHAELRYPDVDAE